MSQSMAAPQPQSWQTAQAMITQPTRGAVSQPGIMSQTMRGAVSQPSQATRPQLIHGQTDPNSQHSQYNETGFMIQSPQYGQENAYSNDQPAAGATRFATTVVDSPQNAVYGI